MPNSVFMPAVLDSEGSTLDFQRLCEKQ